MTSDSQTPFHLHREKLFTLFEEDQKGLVYLKGAEMMYRYNTDFEFPFRQESNFFYLSGVNEPDYHMLLDLSTREFHLFAPKRDTQYAVWHGRIRPDEEIHEAYRPDHLHYQNKLPALLKELNPEVVYCLNDEQAEFIEDLDRTKRTDTETLTDAITYCRCIKSEWELNQLREASRINSIAHREVLKALKPGMYEFEMKALFDYHQIRHGLMQEAYNGIHASGPNSAILHYVENNRQMREGDLYLIDAGHEYNSYASDFTRTYPVSGTFTGDQAAIYQIVRNAHKTTIQAVAPGVKMEDLHLLAARIILEGLRDCDLVTGDPDDLMENNIFALFFPHGLGHFIGLDTHDVGGYPKGVKRIDRPGIRFLRTRREMLPGMVITIEPGLYFIPALLKTALEDEKQRKFLNGKRLEEFLEFGGVRIEDNLIITEEGTENITDVPADIREIEKLMK